MFDPRARQPIVVHLPPGGVRVLESRHTRGFAMAPTRHAFLKIVQPYAGAGWIARGEARTPLRPGDVVFLPAGLRHWIEDDGARPLSLYAVCVSPTLAGLEAEGLRDFRHFPRPAWGPDLRSLVRQLLHEQTLARAGSGLLLAGLALQALGLVARASAGRSAPRARGAEPTARARVEAYARELGQGFYRRQSLDEAAAALGLSRRRFTQLFREVTGESWLTHLQRHRIAHARRLLRETPRSVASIGYECGFEDLTTFYRAFRAAAGTSPVAWRRAPTRARA